MATNPLLYLMMTCALLMPVTAVSYADNVMPSTILVTDMKIALDIDDAFLPVKPASEFEAETSKVYCWFKWKNGSLGETVTVSWKFVAGNIAVLDYALSIPRTEGSGGAALSMPAGKTFPPGEYEATLKAGDKTLKSLRFKILPKTSS